MFIYIHFYRIPPGGEGTATVRLTPKHKGVKTIAVKFWARDLQDVNGYTSVKVSSPSQSIIEQFTVYVDKKRSVSYGIAWRQL